MVFVVVQILISGCASQKPPSGGPKDKDPPLVTIAIPKHQSTNYRGKQIRLVFDEVIDVSNLSQELIISPDPEFEYKERVRAKSLIINLIDTLKENTTYTFNFGEAIRDVTERNSPENLILAFSTGPILDTAKVIGHILNPEDNKPGKKNVVVGLYNYSDTLDPAKHKPTYYTKAEKNGAFQVLNLPEREFVIFGFSDKNQNKLFEPKTEKLAFLSSKVTATNDSIPVQLFLVDQDFSQPTVLRTISGQNNFKVSFTKGLEGFKLDQSEIPFTFSDQMKSVVLFPETKDSTLIGFSFSDSLGIESDSSIYVYLTEDAKPYEGAQALTSDLKDNSKLNTGDSIQISSSIPSRVNHLDSALFILNEDTMMFKKNFNELHGFPWYFSLEKGVNNFGFIFPKGSFISVLGDTLPGAKFHFFAKKPENFGQLEGTVNTEEECYILEVLNSQYQVVARRHNPEKFVFRGLDPGKYILRSLIDKNCNGKWDKGNYTEGIEPEGFVFYEEELQLKANWIQQDKVVEF